MAPPRSGDDGDAADVEVARLSGVFAAPGWLRDIGFTAWLLVGVTLLAAGIIWILSLTHVFVPPGLTAAVVASVASPLVGGLNRHRVPRALGAALLLLGIVALTAGLIVVIVAGITSQFDGLSDQLSAAQDTLGGWLEDVGADPSTAQKAVDHAGSSASDAVSALLDGLGSGISALSSLVFFLALTALSLFFLLKDGPLIRTWTERRLDIPPAVAHMAMQRVLESLRGYFLGVTIVAAFNGVVVAAGALLLGVPLAGTIAVVTFVAAYVPYLGAWTAGAFAVLIALGGAGPEAAAGMVVVALLANGVLQQVVQPFAYGSALGIHPLAVLIVTIAGGALFGAAGLILAAPLTAAATRIASDLRRDREASPAPDGIQPKAATA